MVNIRVLAVRFNTMENEERKRAPQDGQESSRSLLCNKDLRDSYQSCGALILSTFFRQLWGPLGIPQLTECCFLYLDLKSYPFSVPGARNYSSCSFNTMSMDKLFGIGQLKSYQETWILNDKEKGFQKYHKTGMISVGFFVHNMALSSFIHSLDHSKDPLGYLNVDLKPYLNSWD